jgi:hypothetical protein
MKTRLLLLCLSLFYLNTFAQNPVAVYSASSKTPSQGGEDIYKAIDGSTGTLYHSRYNLFTAMPDTVDFFFYNVKSVNQIVYTPRTSGPNGVWKNVDVYHSTVDDPTNFVKDFSFTWNGDNSPKTINYSGLGIVKPQAVRFVVKSANNNYSSCAEMNFFSSETGPLNPEFATCDMNSVSLSSYKDDRIIPSSASVNTYNSSSESIEKTYDGNPGTIYHSQYNFGVQDSKPAILTYNFTNNPSIDYITYYPRQDGNANGRFGNVEIYYKLAGQSAYTLAAATSFGFNSAPSDYKFPARLNNVVSIQIKVKTGMYGYATCSEMVFGKTNFSDLTALTGGVFNDDLLSALKPGTTQTQIDAIPVDFFKQMANCMKNDTYGFRDRVQYYQPYKYTGTLSSELKVGTYNSMENPTGIFFNGGTDAVLFVGPEAANYTVQLKVADYATLGKYKSSTYKLKPGVNIVSIADTGLAYIDYYTNDPAAQPIKIHIANGQINGVFDIATDNDARWMQLINNNSVTYTNIDLKGKNMNLLFDKALLKKYNPFTIKPLISVYDSIIAVQWNMMGIRKYNIKFNNHMFAFANFGGGLYAGGMGMHYDYTWGEASYVSVDGILKGDMWGVAHEIGHVNQLRPSFKWVGMTEVSNNVYATYTQYTMGKDQFKNGRLENENINPYEGDATYSGTYPSVVGGRFKGLFDLAYLHNLNYAELNVFAKAAVIWQLQLYYQIAGALRNAPTLQQRISGQAPAPSSGPDYAYWIADMMQVMRARNVDGVSHGQLAMNFVKDACDATGEDLTDYFIKVGLLKPIDVSIDDYGVRQYTVTQAMINQTIAAVKAKSYPAPVSPVLHYITANSVKAFTNKLLVEGIYGQGLTINANNIIVNHSVWKNVVVFESYDTDNKLVGVAMPGMRDASNQTTYVDYPAEVDKIYALSYDGSKKLVYSRTPLPVTLIDFNAKLQNDAVQLTWATAAETNNKGFEIWKSLDGKQFVKIANVEAKNTLGAQYTYWDRNFTSNSYYKLVQVDKDGRSVSYDDKIRLVNKLQDSSGIKVYPNPVSDILHIDGLSGQSSLRLYDLTGRLILESPSTSQTNISLSLAGLTSGIYQCKVVSAKGTTSYKILKK